MTDRVLTPQELTARLDRAMLRTWRALMDLRQDDVLFEEVKMLTTAGIMPGLAEELLLWVPWVAQQDNLRED